MTTIGIDLGTTNSCAAFQDGATARVIEAGDGSRILRSVVCYGEDGDTLVGRAALEQHDRDPANTFLSMKRLLGQSYESAPPDAAVSLRREIKLGDGSLALMTRDGPKRPEEILSEVVKRLREMATESLGEAPDAAVLTCPAYFETPQRMAVKRAGELAGFSSVSLLNEPTAAALAYGYGRDKYATVCVYDLGGGTFDVAVLELGKGFNRTLATNGNARLGGIDFDELIVSRAVAAFQERTDVDLREKPQAMVRLRRAAEAAKMRLSSEDKAEIKLTSIAFTQADQSPLNLHFSLTREEFEDLARGLVRETLDITQRALGDAALHVDTIDAVVLVGGMTRMPLVRKEVEAFFKKPPERNINPEEVVAIGASIRGASDDYRLGEFSHEDITPKSFGFRASGGQFHPVIAKGTSLPAEKTVQIKTAEDDQANMPVWVLEGDHHLARLNTLLSEGVLPVTPEPAGKSTIELIWAVSSAGALTVTASDGRETITVFDAERGSDEDHITARAEAT